MEAAISRGNVAMTTDAMRQLSANAITNAVTASAAFCTRVDKRSDSALRTSVASAANFDISNPIPFSSLSNQPTSFLSMAETQNLAKTLSLEQNDGYVCKD